MTDVQKKTLIALLERDKVGKLSIPDLEDDTSNLSFKKFLPRPGAIGLIGKGYCIVQFDAPNGKGVFPFVDVPADDILNTLREAGFHVVDNGTWAHEKISPELKDSSSRSFVEVRVT